MAEDFAAQGVDGVAFAAAATFAICASNRAINSPTMFSNCGQSRSTLRPSAAQ